MSDKSLSTQQRAALKLLIAGMKHKEIGHEMVISESTVSSLFKTACSNWAVANTHGLVHSVTKAGLI
jgi:DNA-binding NarL/FixJ family response regulator